jgi:hypothetical protein
MERRRRRIGGYTCHGFLYFVENKVHELIIALQRADDCIGVSDQGQVLYSTCIKFPEADGPSSKNERTFPPPVKLDSNPLVHVFAQIQDILLLRPLGLGCRSSAMTTAMSSSTTSPAAAASSFSSTAIAASPSASTSSKYAAVRHDVYVLCGWKGGVCVGVGVRGNSRGVR